MHKITMPQASKTMRTGTIRQWVSEIGKAVKKGQVIALVEVDEGLVELAAQEDGRLGDILVPAGKTVAVGEVICVMAEAAADGSSRATGSLPASAPAAARADKPPVAQVGSVIPVLMPQAGQSMEEGTIVKWLVQPGASIKKGDVIFEVETDKATMEVEAVDAGRLARIVLAEGGTIAVKQPVAYLANNDADVDAYIASQGTEHHVGAASAAVAAAPVGSASADRLPTPATDSGRTKASPAARKIAKDRGIDVTAIGAGSGPGGRVLSSDVLSAKPGTQPIAHPAAAGGVVRRKMSKMRRAIAANLLASKQTIPHFYVRLTINADAMFAFYRAEKAKYPCSVNDLVTMACAKAIREFPQFRSRIDKDEIVEYPTVNIGIAVGVDDGLTVPVLLNADQMSLKDLAANTKRIAEAARVGKLEGVGQGNFTITNLGMFGVEEFAAIVNPPEPAILAVGTAREAVVVKDGAMRPGRVMTMTLSADHRIIDGLLAAKFMARVKELLENPSQIQ